MLFRMKRIIRHTIPLVFMTLLTLPCNAEKDSKQIADVRLMYSILLEGEFSKFYKEWCHDRIQKQVPSEEEFVKIMNSETGTAITQLFNRAIASVDGEEGSETIAAAMDEHTDLYDITLVNNDRSNSSGHKKRLSRIELKFHEGKWKLFDTD